MRPMAGALERTAVLVIRVWLEEENDAQPLRARITSRLDVNAPRAQATTSAASEREIVAAVRAWLRAFVARG
jgi:hypothetical protein